MKKEMADALLQIMQDNAEPLGKWIAENGDALAALPDVIADADAQAAKVGELLKTGGLADFLSTPSLSGLGLLAYADVVDAQSKAMAGRNKGKKAREEVLALWDNSDWKDSNKSAASFAAWAYKQMRGEYDVDGNKVGKVPSVRTIANWINQHRPRKSK